MLNRPLPTQWLISLKRALIFALWVCLTGAASAEDDVFKIHEKRFETERTLHGDSRYLALMFNPQLFIMAAVHYPNDADQSFLGDAPFANLPYDYSLSHGRAFLIRKFFDLWAAALTGRDSAESRVDRGNAEFCIDTLTRAYSQDLYIQREVEKLKRRHAENTSIAIGDLTGAEIIADMAKHLPEPDPRALIESESTTIRPKNLKAQRGEPPQQEANADIGGSNSKIDEPIGIWNWMLGALGILSAGTL